MKIWGDISKISGVYNSQNKVRATTQSSSVESKKDVISISDQAKDFQSVLKTVREAADVRPERVEALKGQVESGGYNIESKGIADKIVNNLITKTAL